MEIWKDIPGTSGKYQASNDGKIFNVSNGCILKQYLDHKGYYQIGALRKQKQYLVHRIVAAAFLENPNGYKEINHKNGIKTDNRVENLEWVNRSMQMIHAYSIGLRKKYCHANERWNKKSNDIKAA
jgi:hypothetical protein